MNPMLASRLLVMTFLLVILNSIIQGKHSISGFFNLKKSHDILDRTVEGLKSENESLETEISRISNSSDYAKKVLRDKFHLIEDNERLIFFDD